MPTPSNDAPRDREQLIDEQRREIERLREDLRRSEAERQRLRRENEKLKDELEAARRAVYRQAAPFARGVVVAQPRRPGRKAGTAYGRHGCRPRPTRVDETYDVALPAHCPHCAGPVQRTRVAAQFQEDLPIQRPVVRQFRIAVGVCRACGQRVQGRHPLQTSDALGAAAAHLGPQAVALAVILNKQCGLSYGKIAQLLQGRFGLQVTRGGLTQAVQRAARQAAPSYAALCATVRGSPVVTADETSWRVAADLQWLWAFVTVDTTVYAIQPGRGLAQAAHIIGVDYPGVLQRDGWQSYRQFHHALHQTCLAHLLRRCRLLLLDYPQHPFVRAVKATLQAALDARDRFRAGRITAHGLASARGQLIERLGRLLERTPSRRLPIRRFQRHLIVEFDAIFGFLFVPPRRDQLAGGTRFATGGDHAQDLRRRQSHGARCRDATGAHLGSSHCPTSADSMPPI